MKGRSTKVSKNHVVWAWCHLTGLASGHDWIIWSSAERLAARDRVTDRTLRKFTLRRDAVAFIGCDSMRTPRTELWRGHSPRWQITIRPNYWRRSVERG